MGGGPAYTWSLMALQPEFVDGKVPMSIVITDEVLHAGVQ